jgi:MinD superfamily P-loop ATPase
MVISELLKINIALCGQCGGCVTVCATDALYLSPMKLEVDQTLCTACWACVTTCPVGALELGIDG